MTARLENWMTSGYGGLYGEVYDDTQGRFPDGEKIFTSTIKSFDGAKVVTKSGSEYELGEVDSRLAKRLAGDLIREVIQENKGEVE